MATQPHGNSRRRVIHEYKRSLHEKNRDKKRLRKRVGKEVGEKSPVASEKEVLDRTLKRLHTLGIQKFGPSPFSEHFNRWLFDVEAVMVEFEVHPDICADEEFVKERTLTLDSIKQQLKDRHLKEAALNQETTKMSNYKTVLAQINSQYLAAATELRNKKNSQAKQLNNEVNRLKKEQTAVIRLKTGFFRGISKKTREQKEAQISQQLDEAQNKLELAMLNFKAQQKTLREAFEHKREPVVVQIRQLQKMIQSMEVDDSLEERWLACEALIDLVNTFMQKKAFQPN
jgi:hypothetical protein